jgi:hypothetical protein
MTRTYEELDQLPVVRNVSIVESPMSGNDHPFINAPIPAPELIVNSTMNTGNKVLADLSWDGGWGMRRGFSSSNSYYICIFMVSCKIFLPRQADRAYGTEISPRLFVISFVILLYAISYNICI